MSTSFKFIDFWNVLGGLLLIVGVGLVGTFMVLGMLLIIQTIGGDKNDSYECIPLTIHVDSVFDDGRVGIGEREICGQNLTISNEYGPSFTDVIEIQKGEIARLKAIIAAAGGNKP